MIGKRSAYSSAFGLIATLFFIPLFMFYLLLKRPVAGNSVLRPTPEAWRSDLSGLGAIVHREFFAYFRGICMEALLLGGATGFALWLIGVPHAVGLGALTGLAVFIPYVGFVFAFLATIVVVIALEPALIVPVLIISGTLQVIDNWCLSPKFKGQSIGFTPAQTLVILALASTLIGPIGVIIGTPIAAAIRDVPAYVCHRMAPQLPENSRAERSNPPVVAIMDERRSES